MGICLLSLMGNMLLFAVILLYHMAHSNTGLSSGVFFNFLFFFSSMYQKCQKLSSVCWSGVHTANDTVLFYFNKVVWYLWDINLFCTSGINACRNYIWSRSRHLRFTENIVFSYLFFSSILLAVALRIARPLKIIYAFVP